MEAVRPPQAGRLTMLLILLLAGALDALPQTAVGTITGYVEDTTGGRIPQCEIMITHTATGRTRVTSTNERGEFRAPSLAIGRYDISAQVAGFSHKILSSIILRVDQTLTVPIVLEPGAITETVEVVGSPPLLETETSSLGQVIENKKVIDLPLNGRNVFALGLLSGFSVEVFGMGTNQAFAAGGGRFSGNEIMLDGITNSTTTNRGSVGRNSVLYTPSVDAVEEFKVKTNSFSAEFGHAAGAVVSATIKSGSNNFHGTLFHFLRNERLDANNFFSNAAGRPKSSFRQNQFGGAVGGRIIRDRLFFFGDYQGTRRRTTANSSIQDLAPPAFREGDFSVLPVKIYDPASRKLGPAGVVIATPFPNNQIPTSQINDTTAGIQSQIPEPNFGSSGSIGRNFFRQPRQKQDVDQGDLRLDYKVSEANSIFARWSVSNLDEPLPGVFDGPLGGGSLQLTRSRHGVINDVHVFSPTFINEFRFGFTRSNGSRIGDGAAGAEFGRQVGLALFPYPVQGFPGMQFARTGQISGQQLYTSFGGGATNLNVENTFQWVDNATVIRGNHSIKFGADIRRNRFDQLSGGFGGYIFGSIFSSSSDDPGSGDPWADFLLGYPSLQDPSRRMFDWGRHRTLYVGPYIQDDWKVTSRLTLNLGLRYELYTQPVDARDLGGQYELDSQQFVLPGANGYSRAMVDGDHNNFAPRLGLAYRLTPKLAVRASYGIFYGLRDQNDQTTVFAQNIPNVPTLINPVITPEGTVAPPITVNSPITFSPTDPTLAQFSAENPAAFTVQTVDFHNVPYPYMQQWNFSLQYELAGDWLIEPSYAGSKGTKLGARNNLGQVPFEYALMGANVQANRGMPKINGVQGYSAGDANNKYHAFNLRVEKRYSQGLNFLFNYTISKNLESNGSGDSSYSQNGNTSLPLYSFDRSRDNGAAPLDIPQRFVFSYAYELPWGKGKRWLNIGGPLGKIVSGWQVNGITTLRSGFPTDIRTARVAPTFATFNVPDRVSGVSMYVPNKGVDQYFNPEAFALPGTVLSSTGAPIQRFGDSGRHVGRGPGSVNLDFSIFKNTVVTEATTLQFRAEFFNLTNTPTFFLASANSSALSVGQPNFGKLSNSTSVGRQIQFGIKLIF